MTSASSSAWGRTLKVDALGQPREGGGEDDW